ncbi:hypothetical protein AB833_20825 [Chromatiales bacterium (ex Bugula neritina AB1)]|nr:hypothetical protein AB833_20825 [Chromatiales bacterium (ex Bugula neritina AB1)]
MNVPVATEFVYRLPGRSISTRPGAHRSNSRGAGMNFVSHAKLIDQPDPRRLDLRASISSIQKDWLVRINQQRAAINVSAIIDVSASMHFGAGHNKLQVAADFLQALGFSAGGLGDAVGLQAFDSTLREDLSMPPRYGRGIGEPMAELIRHSSPSSSDSASIDALAQCINAVAGKSPLVFIVSDFHWPLEPLDRLLDPIAGTFVVPLVIWDRTEVHPPQGKRLLSARQMGAGTRRHLWLTPAVREQWQANVQSRKEEIAEVFASRDATPFMMTEGFNAEALSRYFMEAAT